MSDAQSKRVMLEIKNFHMIIEIFENSLLNRYFNVVMIYGFKVN